MKAPPEERQQWYDAMIRPKLAAYAKICDVNGMPFIAVVEVNRDHREETVALPLLHTQGLEMTMLHLCAQAGKNLDQFVSSVMIYCKAAGIDLSTSVVAQRMESLEEGNG